MTKMLTWMSRGYAVALSFAYVASLFLIPMAASVWLAVIDAIIGLMSIVGIFACLLARQFLRPRFWRLWLPFLIVWDVLYNLGVLHWVGGGSRTPVVHGGIEFGLLVCGLGGLFVLPAYTLLFMYGRYGGLAWEPRGEAPTGPALVGSSES